MENSIRKGIAFLYRHQLHHGEFLNYVSRTEDMTGPCWAESLTYNTSLICYSLSFLSDYREADEMISKSIHFLNAHMQYGVWNFFSKTNRYFSVLPFDVDSTSLAAAVFRDRGLPHEADALTTKIVLANRSRKGMFYTWIVPRISAVYSKLFLRIGVHVLFSPIRHSIFWYLSNCRYSNVDAGINANVLFYLKERPETQPVIALIIKVINENRESSCDKWYNNPFVIYYFFSRNYFHGIDKLQPICQPIIDRVVAQAKEDGRLGNNLFETGLGVCVLLNLNFRSAVLEKAVQYIINAQNEYGQWERWAHYSAGDGSNAYFGSEEITTALCLEALVRYKKNINSN
jgi:hypothetical protein